MPNGDPREGFSYPTLTLMIDSYQDFFWSILATNIGSFSQWQKVCFFPILRRKFPIQGKKYTQKKKFSQYLCFLIKSSKLDISLSNCIHELYYLTSHVPVYCVINNASIRLYQPYFKIHDVHMPG